MRSATAPATPSDSENDGGVVIGGSIKKKLSGISRRPIPKKLNGRAIWRRREVWTPVEAKAASVVSNLYVVRNILAFCCECNGCICRKVYRATTSPSTSARDYHREVAGTVR